MDECKECVRLKAWLEKLLHTAASATELDEDFRISDARAIDTALSEISEGIDQALAGDEA